MYCILRKWRDNYSERCTMSNKKSISIVQNVVLQNKNNMQKLTNELKRLVNEGQKSGDVLMVGIAYSHLADVYHELGDLNGVLTSALKAEEFLKDTDQYERLVRVYIALSYVYGEQENTQLTLSVCDKAYRIIKNHRIMGRNRMVVLNNIANCYHALGDYKTSIKYLDECLKIAKKEEPVRYSSLAIYYMNLSQNYCDEGDGKKALEVLDNMRGWIDKIDFKPLVCDYYLRRAIPCFELGDLDNGNKHVDEALACVPEKGFASTLYDDFRLVAQTIIEHKDRDRAGKILELMKRYAENAENPTDKVCALRMMTEYYKKFGEDESALDCSIKLNEQYDRRIQELNNTQMNIFRMMKNADYEISKLKNKMKKNEELVSVEPMTKLLNRSALLRVSQEFIDAAFQKKQKVGAIFIDIDYFKECNDTYGHTKGDEIIKKVANACKKEEKSNICFARYGGDEFFGITRGLNDDEVVDIAKRICSRIREENIPNEKSPCGNKLTLSAGVVNVAITDHTDTIIEIANYADKAVYHAKNSGKNAIYLLEYGKSNKIGATFVNIDF